MRWITAALLVCLCPGFVFGQGGGLGGGGGGIGGGGGGIGGGGAGGGAGNNLPGGIAINPDGVVRNIQYKAPSPKLAKKQREALAKTHLPADVNAWAEMRCVSLVKLQAELEQLVEADSDIPFDMKYLAGLQRIDFVFVLPEEGDLILAGPAEGFAPGPSGRPLGITTARPPLRLDDLLVALRVVAKGGELGCSIDPVPANLARTQSWIKANSTAATGQVVKARYEKMAQILGLQDVTVWGLPEDSHLANVLVEADYRMKQIVMGHENPRVKGFKSHLAMLKPGKGSLFRWWFIPLYDKFETNADSTAWRFAGQRAQLLSQEEYANAAGQRFAKPHTAQSANRFAKQFTERFYELSQNVAVFSELQNAFDLTVFAALIKKHNVVERIGWDMSLFMDAERLPSEKLVPAKQIPSSANCKRQGSRLVLGILGGGVVISPRRVLEEDAVETPRMGKALAVAEELRGQRWWWDAVVPKVEKSKTKKGQKSRK
jgi:hypothetical protein